MFSGIIQDLGTIVEITKVENSKIFKISSTLSKQLALGDSIAIDGCCLTVIKFDDETFLVEAVNETLRLTVAADYVVGAKVNLELSVKLADRLHGHLVSGHVDFQTQVMGLKDDGDSRVLTFNLPINFAKYIALKGSVTINGVSLTVSKLLDQAFEVTVIPHTLTHTDLGLLKVGSKVNIEIDLVARYIERLMMDKEVETKYFYLQERNLI